MSQANPAWFPNLRHRYRRVCRATLLLSGILALATLRGADTQISGLTYRPLPDIAARYGMKLSWVTPGKTMVAKNDYCTIELDVNDRSLVLNGQPMALGFPVVARGDTLYLAKLDFDNNIFPLLSPGEIPGVPALHRIVLDPGHGGKDTGTTNDDLKANEKTNTLDVALRLADLLRKRGYEVVLTRTKDVYVELTDRTAIANRAKGDLYISIHFNNAPQKAVDGIETWLLPPAGEPPSNIPKPRDVDKQVLPGNRYDFWNTIVAFSLERSATRELDTEDRGLKREHLVVLKGLNMPGVLIECGFLSSPSEGAKIITPDYHQQIATAIADGIDLYKATLDQLRQTKAPAPVRSAPPPPPGAAPHHPESVNEVGSPN